MIQEYYHSFIYIWIIFGLILFPVLLKIPAPYGRHNRKGWGPSLPNKAGWIIMELPALLVFIIFFFSGATAPSGITWLFFGIWFLHYTNRSIFYPLRTKTKNKKMPVVIIAFALIFNLVNGFINGFYFGNIRPVYDLTWLYDPRFILGFLVFITGMLINIRSDGILLSLRKNSSQGYSIPYGGMFRYISCPNFLGEIIEWFGFAIMSWSPAALAFALWTVFNLIPRALDHHNFYKDRFEEYPSERRAIIPFVL
jgi:protein-S-isoprenylcysteine O-methyltransferase Ste14